MKKKVLIVCGENATGSRIAEGYLKHYGLGQLEVFSVGISKSYIHPLALKVMEEDSIDMTETCSKQGNNLSSAVYDYVITFDDSTEGKLPSGVIADQHLHYSIPNLVTPQSIEAQNLDVLRQTREIIKTYVLRFIGKEIYASRARLSVA